MDFNTAFYAWLEKCRGLVKAYYSGNYPNLPVPDLDVMRGPKYIRIIKVEGSIRYAWAFVEISTGNVLKCDGWKRPAKHPRGNIFDEKGGMAFMSAYGPAYLR